MQFFILLLYNCNSLFPCPWCNVFFPPPFSSGDHSCKSSRGVSDWPGWTSSLCLSINPPIYPSHLWSSQAPCWCGGWLGLPCCLWTGLQAAGPSSPPGLRVWEVASRETAGTFDPTLSWSWPTTRMLSWVRFAHFLSGIIRALFTFEGFFSQLKK